MGASGTPEGPWWEAWWPEELWPEVSLTPEELKKLGEEIGKVRQRGIRRVDLVAPRQPRKETPILDSLADLYASLKSLDNEDRPVRLRELLWHGVKTYANRNGKADSAALVSDLFFPPDDPNKFVSPGVLLDNVIKRIGHTGSRSSFDRLRRQEFEEFGAYLVAFVNAEAEQVNERIKVDRVQEKADKERIEAERFKKEAKEQKKRAKKEPAKGHVQTEEDGKRASGKAQESSRRTPDERKRRMQLAREKFIRQQQRRKEEQAKTRKRNLVIFCAVYALIATLVISYEVAPEHFPAWMSSTSWPKWLGG